jgi:hypothetical protein
MEKVGADDDSDYAPAIDDNRPDNDLDADFDDGSNGKKKLPAKPSSKSASKVIIVNNQEAPIGSLLKWPPGGTKSDAAKYAAMTATKKKKICWLTPLCQMIIPNLSHQVQQLQHPFATKAKWMG